MRIEVNLHKSKNGFYYIVFTPDEIGIIGNIFFQIDFELYLELKEKFGLK
jgi:hypothetical protein